jgi:hypothetical protein
MHYGTCKHVTGTKGTAGNAVWCDGGAAGHDHMGRLFTLFK